LIFQEIQNGYFAGFDLNDSEEFGFWPFSFQGSELKCIWSYYSAT